MGERKKNTFLETTLGNFLQNYGKDANTLLTPPYQAYSPILNKYIFSAGKYHQSQRIFLYRQCSLLSQHLNILHKKLATNQLQLLAFDFRKVSTGLHITFIMLMAQKWCLYGDPILIYIDTSGSTHHMK